MHSGREKDIGDRRAEAGCGVPRRKAWWAMVFFVVVSLLLNGRHIHEKAKRRPYDKWWQVWVTLSRPLAQASTLTRLDRPRTWLEERLGQEGEGL